MFYKLLISLNRTQKSFIFLGLDLFLMAFALVMTNAMLLGVGPTWNMVEKSVPYLMVMLPVAAGLVLIFQLHRVQLNFYERVSILHTGIVALLTTMSGLMVSFFLGQGISIQFFIIVALVFVVLSAGSRLVLREIVSAIYSYRGGNIRVLIYGAGRTGQQLAEVFSRDTEIRPVAFADNDRALHGLTIAGLKVHPARRLEHLVDRLRIDRIILAMPSVSETDQAAIAKGLSHLACEVHSMPSFASMVKNGTKIGKTEPLDFSKLLGRNHLASELPGIREMYTGKVVLVTGAGGSIGSELAVQIASSEPSRLILLDHSEIALYQIKRKLEARFPDVPMQARLGSVCVPEMVEQLFVDEKIDVVLHAAAYKHLPMLEANAFEGLRNNVVGTRVVALAAQKYGAESFILISTDKAVRPKSWLGFSKRFAEIIVQDMANRSDHTRMSMVRFGNVLGSSGSVIPLFQEQIERGGPVTLTHNDVTRYFMTVSEAVRLVLLAGSFARGGDVFVLDMGDPISIRELARTLIENSGYSVRDAANPTGDIELLITGLRPGEKIREELLIGSDMLTTLHPKILRAQEIYPSEIEVATMWQEIHRAIRSYRDEDLDALAAKWAHYLGHQSADAASDEQASQSV